MSEIVWQKTEDASALEAWVRSPDGCQVRQVVGCGPRGSGDPQKERHDRLCQRPRRNSEGEDWTKEDLFWGVLPSGCPYPSEYADPYHGGVNLQFESAEEARRWADENVEKLEAPVECFTIGSSKLLDAADRN